MACKKLMVMINCNLRGMHAPKPKLSNGHTQEYSDQSCYMLVRHGELYKHTSTNKKLKSLDRLATKSTATVTRNTPQASLEIMIDLLPIELMIQKNWFCNIAKIERSVIKTIFHTRQKLNPTLAILGKFNY